MSFFIDMNEERYNGASVLYRRRTGSYGKENAALMNDFKDWLKAHGLFCDEIVILGIPLDHPGITEPQLCRYDVCAIDTGWEKNDLYGVERRKLDSGDYVVFLIEHTEKAVQRAWSECFMELEKQGYVPDTARPVMERYAKKHIDNHCCELCVPVLK